MKRSLSRLQPLRRVAALVLASLLAACSLTPDHVRPAPPVAPAWVDAGSATGTTAADLDWADFLTDERIRALVRLALQNNRDLRIAVLNVEQVRALYGVQRADRLPSVGVGAAAARAANGNGDAYTVGFAVSAFELDLFGRVKALSDAALARYLASDEGRRAAQMTLIAAVANAELTLRADDEQLQVTRSTLASRAEVLRLVRVRFEGGVAAEPELRAAESLLAGAQANLAALQRQRQQDLNALVLLLGQPLPADLPPAPPLNALTLAELPVGLPSEVLLQRPDIRAAEQQLIAANANIGAARAAFFPRITLTASAGFASDDLGGLFENRAWQFAPRITLPIFDAGANQANLEVSQTTRDIAVAQYERSIQVAFREVADSLAARATLGEQLRAQRAQAQAEETRYLLATMRYQNGVASYLDVLDAQRALFLVQQGVIVAQASQWQNLVTLYKVLGGGWKDAAN